MPPNAGCGQDKVISMCTKFGMAIDDIIRTKFTWFYLTPPNRKSVILDGMCDLFVYLFIFYFLFPWLKNS